MGLANNKNTPQNSNFTKKIWKENLHTLWGDAEREDFCLQPENGEKENDSQDIQAGVRADYIIKSLAKENFAK